MNKSTSKTVFLWALLLAPLAAHAYVGPGAGLSLLGALWALLVAIGAALVFLVAWPLRRMRRRKREAIEEQERQEAGVESAAHGKADEAAPTSNVKPFHRPPEKSSESRATRASR